MFGLFKQRPAHLSPNFNDRKGVTAPDMVILHYTGMTDAQSALERLCSPDSEVSAHYFIETSGKTHQLVPDKHRAWHAGRSYWDGVSDINSHSIGIELENPGHDHGYRPFPGSQIASLLKLLQRLKATYQIAPDKYLAHSDIAPDRKQDPGELFPWQALAQKGFGLWPSPAEMDYQNAHDLHDDADRLRQTFHNFGYSPDHPLDVTICAFHRHYYPEKFQSGEAPDQADNATIARLLNLLRQKFELPA